MDFGKVMIIMANGLLLLVMKVFFSIAERVTCGKINMVILRHRITKIGTKVFSMSSME